MKQRPLIALAVLPILSGCATIPQADFASSVPAIITVDVAPGYKRALSLNIPDSGVIQVHVANIRHNPTKEWMPTAFIALNSEDSDVTYGLNITTDIDLQKQFMHARLIDLEAKKELSNYRHHELLPATSENTLRIEISGTYIRSFVNQTLVDERQLPFEPTYYDVGASSGSYTLTVIEAPPPPAPE